MNAILAIARLAEIDCSAPNAVFRFLFELDEACIINVPKWSIASQKRGRAGESIVSMTRPEVSPQYVEEVCGAGMRRAYAQSDWYRY